MLQACSIDFNDPHVKTIDDRTYGHTLALSLLFAMRVR
jgi:hypothetical protein